MCLSCVNACILSLCLMLPFTFIHIPSLVKIGVIVDDSSTVKTSVSTTVENSVVNGVNSVMLGVYSSVVETSVEVSGVPVTIWGTTVPAKWSETGWYTNIQIAFA